jgi:hypothetical protein
MAETKTFQERLKEYEEILNKYTEGFGLQFILYNKEVEPVLGLVYDQIQNLDSDGCDSYAYLLNQYSLVLTKEINRNKARLNWAQKQLDLLVASQAKKYVGADEKASFIKYELLCNRVILNDSSAQVLNSIILHAGGRVQELENIHIKIDLMAKTLSNLARTRYDGRRGNS